MKDGRGYCTPPCDGSWGGHSTENGGANEARKPVHGRGAGHQHREEAGDACCPRQGHRRRSRCRPRWRRGTWAGDARAIRDLYKAAPTDLKGLRRTIRRSELRQIVPLADSTIYELERRGEFPQRFYLTARCVVWDLAEVMAWLKSRRQAGRNGVKRPTMPDVRMRMRRPIGDNG